ncbi:MAG: hypothetical protein ACKN9U_08210 [Pirellulaceae bacterium]
MIFNSVEFLFFFLPITYLVFWMLKTANARYVWLTITGYVFYGWWDARFCLLIGMTSMTPSIVGCCNVYVACKVPHNARTAASSGKDGEKPLNYFR